MQTLLAGVVALWIAAAPSGSLLAQETTDGPARPLVPIAPLTTDASLESNADPNNPAATGDDQAAAAPLRKVQPSVFYMKDAAGNLKPVINIPYLEFKRLWELDRGIRQPEQLPRYTIQQFNVTGLADGQQAELDVTIHIQPRVQGSWIRIPLGMKDAILREPAKHQGAGVFDVRYHDSEEGYTAWVKTDSEKPFVLTMKLLAPLFRVGTQTRLALSAPRSTSSQLKLRVHADQAVGDVSRGADLNATKYSKDAVGPVTEFTVLGLRDDFQLTWREGNRQPSRVEAALEAIGNVLVRIDGQKKTATADVRLNVQIAGGEIDSLEILLPPGATSLRSLGTDYSITLVEDKPQPGNKPPTATLAAVTFDAKTTGAKEIHFIAELPSQGNDNNFWFEIGRFEVQQAVRQSGHIALVVEGDYSASWDLRQSRAVRRVDELPDLLREAAAEVTLTAAFEYFRQPGNLRVQLEARTKHVSVQPTYNVTVEEGKVVLDAQLNYSIRSAKADFLDVDLDGWLVDRVLAIDADGQKTPIPADLDAVRPLVIPLSPARTGDFEIRILAHQMMENPDDTLSFALPLPAVDSAAPARVVVQPADNIGLTPRTDQITGLLPDPDPVVAETMATTYQQSPLYLRQYDQPSAAEFVSGFEVHTREIRAESAVQALVSAEHIAVEQTLTYQISYERENQLRLLVPQTLFDLDKVELELDRQPLAADLFQASRVEQEDGQSSELSISLGAGKIGVCELVIRYQIPLRDLPQRTAAVIAIPLVKPVLDKSQLAESKAVIRTIDETAVESKSPDWKLAGGTPVSASAPLALSANAPAPPLLLAVRRTRPVQEQRTHVSKSWIQTWLGTKSRQDRAVFEISTGLASVRLRLPREADPKTVVALVDGVEASPTVVTGSKSAGSTEMDIPLGDAAAVRTVRVEIWYPLPRQRASLGLELDLPEVVSAQSVMQTNWLLITPRNEHLVGGPFGMTPVLAWRWNWQDMQWGQRSRLSAAELEKWIGATPQDLPSSTNQYLFSDLKEVSSLRISTLSRGMILLLLSGGTLLIGMLLVNFPNLRHPRVLTVACVVLLLWAIVWPTSALLIAQASAVGVVLTLLSQSLSWMVARRADRRAVIRGSSITDHDHGSDLRSHPIENSSHATTATAPISLGMSPEVK